MTIGADGFPVTRYTWVTHPGLDRPAEVSAISRDGVATLRIPGRPKTTADCSVLTRRPELWYAVLLPPTTGRPDWVMSVNNEQIPIAPPMSSTRAAQHFLNYLLDRFDVYVSVLAYQASTDVYTAVDLLPRPCGTARGCHDPGGGVGMVDAFLSAGSLDPSIRGFRVPKDPRDAPEHVKAAIRAGHVREVVVFCDGCGVQDRADYTGAVPAVRLAAARRHLKNNAGWDITADHDRCPACRKKPTS